MLYFTQATLERINTEPPMITLTHPTTQEIRYAHH